MREPGKDPVWVTRSSAPPMLRKDVSAWRKKTFIDLEGDGLTKLAVTHPDGSRFTVEKTDGAWALTEPTKLPGGFRFDVSAADTLARQLSGLQAQKFADQGAKEESFGLADSKARVEAVAKDGQTLSVRFGKHDDASTVPVKVEGDAQIYLVGKWAPVELPRRGERARSASAGHPREARGPASREPVIRAARHVEWIVRIPPHT